MTVSGLAVAAVRMLRCHGENAFDLWPFRLSVVRRHHLLVEMVDGSAVAVKLYESQKISVTDFFSSCKKKL